ncbi:MAG: sporulation protein YunB [Clostridia bacterium]|nr:sporulation protein YunB [Clostridia bacterium]
MTTKAYEFVRRKKRIRKKTKLKIFGLCFLLFAIACFAYYFKVVCPVVVSLSRDKIHSLTTSSISNVVGDVLRQSNVGYGDLIKISYSVNNEIELIEVDSVKVNLLIRQVTEQVQEKFDKIKGQGVGVALGTFTGIPFLYGMGPDVSIQLVPVGTVKTRLESSFVGAGINQTLHRLNFVVSASVGLVLPANTQNITTELEVMICESIIVGKIPNVYLQGSLI